MSYFIIHGVSYMAYHTIGVNLEKQHRKEGQI